MSGGPVLGELLDLASRHSDAAEGAPARGRADETGVLGELRGLVTVMARYLDVAVPANPTVLGRPLRAGERAIVQQREYLHRAALFLEAVPALPPALRPPAGALGGDGQASGLASAAGALAAGRELLLTHYHLPPWGGPQPRSRWALALASEHGALAVAGEIAQWAQAAAAWAGWAAGTIPRQDGEPRECLESAQFLLTAAARSAGPRTSTGAAFRRELLRAIPLCPPPGRLPPDQAEDHAALCAGIMATAGRLRAQTFLAPWQHPPRGSGPAWRRSSQACAITCDLASKAMPVLAARAARMGIPLAPAGSPRDAPAETALAEARDAWLALARCWQLITTDAQDPSSPVTTDATDLVIRMGRLVSGDPHWTPARRQQAPWDPAGPAPDAPGLRLTVAAIHHATDAIEGIARADLRGVQSAGSEGRLYMDAGIIGDTAPGPRPYLEAPDAHRYLLQCACQATIDASTQAARALDDLATQCGAPSEPVALIRAAAPPDPANRALQAPPAILLDLDRPKDTGRARATIDHQAIITAHADNGMTARQISWLFPITAEKAAAILRDNGITLAGARPCNRRTPAPTTQRGSRQRRTTAQQSAAGIPGTSLRPPPSPAAPEAQPPRPSP